MTNTNGSARLRYDYEAERDLCLNCPLAECVLVLCQSTSLLCPLNARRAEQQQEAEARKRAA